MANSVLRDDGMWQISMKNPARDGSLTIGTLISIFPRRGFTWRALNSSKVTAEDVTIHAGGNMGFLERYGAGGHIYRRVAITRKPGSDGLMALNADGFHSASVGVGATIEDSEIAFTGDDILNTHTEVFVICQ